MKFRMLTVSLTCFVFAIGLVVSAFGQEPKPIQLPEPKLDPSKSLAQALKERKTTREYDTGNLSQQVLSNLLWAACGINRADSGRRTAPSALNWQEIDVYVATTQGMYLYDPKGNVLMPIVLGDIRGLTFTQVDRFKDAPLHLVYVADLARTGDGEEATKMPLVAMDTGFVAENVYLYCASEGLATAYRVSIDKKQLAEAIKLRTTQRIMGAQSVGLPKSK
jgi:hypothetical protein